MHPLGWIGIAFLLALGVVKGLGVKLAEALWSGLVSVLTIPGRLKALEAEVAELRANKEELGRLRNGFMKLVGRDKRVWDCLRIMAWDHARRRPKAGLEGLYGVAHFFRSTSWMAHEDELATKAKKEPPSAHLPENALDLRRAFAPIVPEKKD